jgi:hypothetical protein
MKCARSSKTDQVEEVQLMRGSEIVVSLLGAFRQSLKETRLTSWLIGIGVKTTRIVSCCWASRDWSLIHQSEKKIFGGTRAKCVLYRDPFRLMTCLRLGEVD